MNPNTAQQIIREVSPIYLEQRGVFLKKEATPEIVKPTGQNEVPGPSTLAELSDALRDPLPQKPVERRSLNALEAWKEWKPLTLDMVRDILAAKRVVRDTLLREYTERTGCQVDYCDECDLGVVEEEIEEGYGTRVEASPCEACDGLGVIAI